MRIVFRLYIALILFALLSSCSMIRQRQISSRLTAEWHVQRYEIQNDRGNNVVINDAGTIELSSNGRGMQTFNPNLAHMGQLRDNQFVWDNTERTVNIRFRNNQPRKVWIIVESSRTRQLWYSTDDQGNVQILTLRRNPVR
jgi:hypothetical protein